MPSRLQETLNEKVRARLRSSTKLLSRDVFIHMSDRRDDVSMKIEKVLEIEDVPIESAAADAAGTKEAVIVLMLKDITDIKVKNFVEKSMPVYVVSITCPEVQYFLEFDAVEKRDDWGNGLRSLLHAFQWANRKTETASDTRKLHMIKAINLQLPREGMLVSMEVETAAGKKGDLDVPDQPLKYDSASCKELIHDFVLQNFIVPAEGASLYRFVRSVISRLLMERETNVILGEIDANRFNRVVEGGFGPASKEKADVNEARSLLHAAEAKLKELALVLPDRIGKHGPSSQLIVDILARSIEKTKIYNRMAFAVHYGESGEGADEQAM